MSIAHSADDQRPHRKEDGVEVQESKDRQQRTEEEEEVAGGP